MPHPYEYAIMMKYLTPIIISGTPDFAKQESQLALTNELSKFIGEMPKALDALPDGEGWFPNSHNVTFAGNTVVLSILLQRHHK